MSERLRKSGALSRAIIRASHDARCAGGFLVGQSVERGHMISCYFDRSRAIEHRVSLSSEDRLSTVQLLYVPRPGERAQYNPFLPRHGIIRKR